MELKLLLRICLLLFLCVAAFMDVREKQISVLYVAAGSAAGVLLQIFLGTMRFSEAAGGCLVGAAVLLIAFLTREQIGYGDGLVLVTTGVFLGVLENIILLLASLVIAVLAGVLLVRLKRIKRRQRIPFIPFLLAGYIFVLLL